MKKLICLLVVSSLIAENNDDQKNKLANSKPSADSKVITCGKWTRRMPIDWQLLQDDDDYWLASRKNIKETSELAEIELYKHWYYDRVEIKKTPEGKVYEITLSSSKDTLDLLDGYIQNKDGQTTGQVEQSDECKAIAAMYHELKKLKTN